MISPLTPGLAGALGSTEEAAIGSEVVRFDSEGLTALAAPGVGGHGLRGNGLLGGVQAKVGQG
jgi:hypothetical protein